MAVIARIRLPLHTNLAAVFDTVAHTARAWLQEQGVPAREAVVLLPFAQLLPAARRAFGAGWQPRVETTQTLAAALGPPPPADAQAPTFDAALDRLLAARMLRSLPWGRAWQRARPASFDAAVAAMVETTHAFARRAQALAPSARAAWWDEARAALAAAPSGGPGEREQALARVALEWAALCPAPASDRLHALGPAAWIDVRAGRADPVAAAVLDAADTPALVIETDRRDGDAMRDWLQGRAPRVAVCRDLEDEAQAAAADVLQCLAEGQRPVALVAHDRTVTRRVHALLARRAVAVSDETGWRLSTTRAAASLMAWLRAARPDASTDEVLDALTDVGDEALPALDRALRRLQVARRGQVVLPDRADPAAAALWTRTVGHLEAYARQPAQVLAAWRRALDALLRATGARARLEADTAGRQVLAALGLDDLDAPAPAAASALELRREDVAAWIDAVLEEAHFIAPPSPDEPAVVITPLARALLRPFAALVMPGCDHRHLGLPTARAGLLSDGQARILGLPTVRDRLDDQRQAFWHALRQPRVLLLRRRVDEGEPLVASPLLERLALDWRAETGELLPDWVDPRTARRVAADPQQPPRPVARRLPVRLSATQVEALRACPYRFFSRCVLGLDEADELDEDADKGDYGSWLHAVLLRFHRHRVPGVSRDDDLAALLAAAADESRRGGVDADASFLPFEASFETLAPRYVDWQRERDAEDQRWAMGEHPAERPADARTDGVVLHGRLDRIDRDAREAAVLIDYKTGSVSGLKERVKRPLEDTQLAFYAALLEAAEGDCRAGYLALDDTGGAPQFIAHDGVAASGRALVDGVGAELARMRAGAPLLPLGVGRECERCEARGLCRRDDWSHDLPEAAS